MNNTVRFLAVPLLAAVLAGAYFGGRATAPTQTRDVVRTNMVEIAPATCRDAFNVAEQTMHDILNASADVVEGGDPAAAAADVDSALAGYRASRDRCMKPTTAATVR